MRKTVKNISIAVAVFFVLAGLFSLYSQPLEKVEEVSLSQLAKQINEGKIAKIEVAGNRLSIETVDEKKQKSQKEIESSLSESLINIGVDKEKLKEVQITNQDDSSSGVWRSIIIPFLLPFLMIAFFVWLDRKSVV